MSKSNSKLPPAPSKTTEPIKKIGSEFIIKKKYQNTLPDIPFLPKLLNIPNQTIDTHKWTTDALAYPHTYDLYDIQQELASSLDTMYLSYLHDYHTNKDLFKPSTQLLDPEDKILMTPALDQKAALISRHRPVVPWLRRTEYISTEAAKNTIPKVMELVQPIFNESEMREFMDRSIEGQIRTIEKTFKVSKDLKTLVHPKNKNLKVVEILPVFPDFENWGNEYHHVVYDTNPITSNELNKQETEAMQIQLEEALLKPMSNPTDPSEVFISYYTPNPTTLSTITQIRKMRQEADEEVEEMQGTITQYDYVRDYDYTTTHEQDSKKLFFLLKPKEGAFYNPLDTKLVLRRKRAKGVNDRPSQVVLEKPVRVVVKKRKLNKSEKMARRARLMVVAPIETMEESSDDSESEENNLVNQDDDMIE